LISNVKYEHPDIHTINIDEQQSLDLSDFKDNYVHLSSNHVHMERLCFERWFIMRNYMRKHNIARAIFLDVDVVCVQDLVKILPYSRNIQRLYHPVHLRIQIL